MPLNEDKYLYPRVKISQHVLKHSSVAPAVEDTTVLFAPIYTSRGPAGLCDSNIHSLAEFIEVYGNIDYTTNGQMALIVYNWLHNGGTVCVYRLVCGEDFCHTDDTLNDENDTYTITAKYPGYYYGSLAGSDSKVKKTVIEVKPLSEKLRKVIVKYNGVRVEEFSKLTISNYVNALKNSEYIGNINVEKFNEVFDESLFTNAETRENGISFTLVHSSTSETTYEDVLSAITDFYSENGIDGESVYDVLSNTLTPNVDIILDAGYNTVLKKNIRAFLRERDDIIGIFDLCDLGSVKPGYETPIPIADFETEVEDGVVGAGDTRTNVAVYDQYFTIYDSIFTDTQIYVTPTYFLSKLIPFNDINYGIQYATAGTRRGVLTDALSVSYNPSPDEKQAMFVSRVNYVEKSPREYAFMSQRTFDGSDEEEYTALSFLNNARTLERIKKEIRALGREYLFEFNDSTTLAQMQNVLNRYINNWISNRTLATGTVSVRRSDYSDEAVDVTISIRFNGTIEIISVDLTIE